MFVTCPQQGSGPASWGPRGGYLLCSLTPRPQCRKPSRRPHCSPRIHSASQMLGRNQPCHGLSGNPQAPLGQRENPSFCFLPHSPRGPPSAHSLILVGTTQIPPLPGPGTQRILCQSVCAVVQWPGTRVPCTHVLCTRPAAHLLSILAPLLSIPLHRHQAALLPEQPGERNVSSHLSISHVPSRPARLGQGRAGPQWPWGV